MGGIKRAALRPACDGAHNPTEGLTGDQTGVTGSAVRNSCGMCNDFKGGGVAMVTWHLRASSSFRF